MSFLAVTIPVSLLLAALLLALVIRRVRAGDFEDWEGPAARMLNDDDAVPEHEAALDVESDTPHRHPGG